MTYQSKTHTADLEKAVVLAHRAETIGRLAEQAPLTRFLYRHWFLGKPVLTVRSAPPVSAVPTVPRQGGARPRAWRTWGPAWTEDRTARGADLVRLHLSCAPGTSLHAFATVSSHAREWDVPWLLTSRAVHQQVPDPDATVLLLPGEALDDLRRPLERLLDDLRPFLATSVPALTLRVAPGATLGQNPSDGRSYGEHRCGLIAASVLQGLGNPHRDLVGRTRQSFADAGVDPVRPYRAADARWDWHGAVRAA